MRLIIYINYVVALKIPEELGMADWGVTSEKA